MLRGTAQNPDVFFQAREAANRYYDAYPGVVEERDGPVCGADRAGAINCSSTLGHPEAERVIVIMGSGGETVARDGGATWPPAVRKSAC